MQRKGKNMKISLRKMVYLSLLVAIGVVLKVFKIPVPILGLTFTGFPTILAGVIFGPISGFIVGAMADVLGFIFRPTGAFMPHFTLSAALTGAIPGLIINWFKRENLNFWHYLLGIGVGQIITSVFLVSYFLYILFGLPFKVKLVEAAITQLQHIPLYAVIVKIIAERIYQADILDEADLA
jgi:ECF transporter S component (folate family)